MSALAITTDSGVTSDLIGLAVFDLSNPYITLPLSMITAIYGGILGAKSINAGKNAYSQWIYPCELKTIVSFAFADAVGKVTHFALNPVDFDLGPSLVPGYCLGALQPSPYSFHASFGLPFSKSFYT